MKKQPVKHSRRTFSEKTENNNAITVPSCFTFYEQSIKKHEFTTQGMFYPVQMPCTGTIRKNILTGMHKKSEFKHHD